MGLINVKNVKLCGKKGCVKTDVIFDTGAESNFISKKIADEIGVTYTGEKDDFQMADTKKRRKYNEAVIKQINISRNIKRNAAMVHVGKTNDTVIGHPLMQKLRLQIDMKNHKLKKDKKYLRF